MRVRVLALVLATAALVWPWAARADGERTLVDLTIEVSPIRASAECFRVEPGHLTTTVALAGDNVYAVRYVLGPAANTDAPRTVTPVAAQATAYTLDVAAAGTYCYTFQNGAAPAGRQLYRDEVAAYTQQVAFKLVWAP